MSYGVGSQLVSWWDVEKWRCSHSWRQNKTIASAKVRRVL